MASSKKQRNQFIVEQILREEGLPRLAIAGLLGSIEAESDFNPEGLNKDDPGDGSFGIFQWNSSRRRALESFAAGRNTGPEDIETQARFLAAEVRGEIGTEGRYGQRLLAATNAQEASRAAISLVRPQGWTRANPEGGLGYARMSRFTRGYIDATSQPGMRDSSPFAGDPANSKFSGSSRSDSRLPSGEVSADGSEEDSQARPLDAFLIGLTEGLKNIDATSTEALNMRDAEIDSSMLRATGRSITNFFQQLPGSGLQSIRR